MKVVDMQEREIPTTGNGDIEDKKPWDLPRRQVMFALASILLVFFMSSLNMNIVGVAMPRIIEDLRGFSLYTWVTTAYMLSLTVMLPLSGKLSDLYGRKWVYAVGIVIFLLGSLLCGLSQSMNALIGARAFQGIGAGMIMASSLASFGDLFPPEERGKYVGAFMAVMGLSSVLGPTVGGYITDHLSWNWIFYISLPVGIPAFIFFLLYFPKIPPATSVNKIDYPGMTALAAVIISLVLGLSWGGSEYTWGSPQVIGTLSFAAFMLVVFIMIESRTAESFIPLGLFKNRNVNIANAAGFLTGFGQFGAILFVPLFFQGVLGRTASSSGTFLIPMMLGVAVGGALGGQAVSRLGGSNNYRNVLLFGLVLMAIGAFLLSQMTSNTSNGQVITYIAIFGFGVGIHIPVLMIIVQNTVPYEIMGVASSLNMFFRQIGGTLGLAIFGSLMTSRLSSELTGNVSPEVIEVLTPDGLSELADNPQALMGPEALEQLQAQFSDIGQGQDLFQQLMDTLRHALSTAITDIFLIILSLAVLASIIVLFIRKIPHRV